MCRRICGSCSIWVCGVGCATPLLCARSSTADRQRTNIWALASKDASWHRSSRWRCASSFCFMAGRALLQAEATHSLLRLQTWATAAGCLLVLSCIHPLACPHNGGNESHGDFCGTAVFTDTNGLLCTPH